MSETNERSVASLGSVAGEPVAWAVLLADGRIYDVYDFQEEAKAIDEAVTGNHGVVPLYRSPTLTDAEREAVDTAEASLMRESTDMNAPQPVRKRLGAAAATLRGLLERLSSSPSISGTGNSAETANEPEPAIPLAILARKVWVDPPEGWRWGFPRLYDPATDGDMTEWMIRHGYPERLARQKLACTFTAATEGDTVAKDDNACRNNLTETGEK